MMKIQVEIASGGKADEQPLRFRLGTQNYRVQKLLDQWCGPDDRYFKVQADDGNIYILRHHMPEGGNGSGWRLEAFCQAASDSR